MSKSFTLADPRYSVKGPNGEYFSVHKTKYEAIYETIVMSFEYPGTTFVTVKSVNWEDQILFSFQINLKFEFSETRDIYAAFAEYFQKKIFKTKFWR